MINSAALSKVKIIGYQENKESSGNSETYEVMINPSSISHSHSVNYNTQQIGGSVDSTTSFNNIAPETLSFEIIVDGTGATGTQNNVMDEISKLKKVTYEYNGEAHENSYNKIIWGDALSFFGRLSNMDITHTLFAPSGQSLRAKISLKFVSSTNLVEQMKKMQKSSPDLTHLVKVKIGDTLPMMCQRIYKATHYYMQIAKINNLVNFRDLTPGQELIFPPIKK